MRSRPILIFIALALLAGCLIGYTLFVQEPAKAADRKTEVSVPAAALYKAFTQDEMAAGKIYNDKVVEVTGVVRDLNTGADHAVDVMLETGDPMGAVVCEFAASEKVAAIKGDTARIKGFCAGYNLDVLLQRCSMAR